MHNILSVMASRATILNTSNTTSLQANNTELAKFNEVTVHHDSIPTLFSIHSSKPTQMTAWIQSLLKSTDSNTNPPNTTMNTTNSDSSPTVDIPVQLQPDLGLPPIQIPPSYSPQSLWYDVDFPLRFQSDCDILRITDNPHFPFTEPLNRGQSVIYNDSPILADYEWTYYRFFDQFDEEQYRTEGLQRGTVNRSPVNDAVRRLDEPEGWNVSILNHDSILEAVAIEDINSIQSYFNAISMSEDKATRILNETSIMSVVSILSKQSGVFSEYVGDLMDLRNLELTKTTMFIMNMNETAFFHDVGEGDMLLEHGTSSIFGAMDILNSTSMLEGISMNESDVILGAIKLLNVSSVLNETTISEAILFIDDPFQMDISSSIKCAVPGRESELKMTSDGFNESTSELKPLWMSSIFDEFDPIVPAMDMPTSRLMIGDREYSGYFWYNLQNGPWIPQMRSKTDWVGLNDSIDSKALVMINDLQPTQLGDEVQGPCLQSMWDMQAIRKQINNFRWGQGLGMFDWGEAEEIYLREQFVGADEDADAKLDRRELSLATDINGTMAMWTRELGSMIGVE